MRKHSKLIILLLIIAAGSVLTYFTLVYLPMNENNIFLHVLNGSELTTYQNSCNEMDISQSFNNPSVLNGQKVKVKGQITKIEKFQQFNKNHTYIEIIISNYTPVFYIIISYAEVTSFNVGDNITVYGRYEYPVKTSATPALANKDLIKINAVHIDHT